MSRGPGKWQREILGVLDRDGRKWVADIGLPIDRSEYAAVIRAAHALARSGRIGLVRVLYCGNVRLLAIRADLADTLTQSIRDMGLSVETVPSGTDSTHTRRMPGSVRSAAERAGGVPKSTASRWDQEAKAE